MASVQTPYGFLEWPDTAPLKEHTVVTLTRTTPDGVTSGTLPLWRLIAMTNGAVIPFLPVPDHPATTAAGPV